MAEIVINDLNWRNYVGDAVVDGKLKARGYVPRDYRKCPVGFMRHVKAFDLPLIPESEWESRLAAQKAAKARLSDIRNTALNGQRIPSLDQNGQGYCWAYGPVSAMLLARAVAGLPYVDLSPHAVAYTIKGGRDEGGWGIEAMEFIAQRGVPSSEFWPQKSMSRANDNPQTWENAKFHVNSEWMDLEPGNVAQLVTCLLSNIPLCGGFNWWGHEVCLMDLESIRPLQTRCWNSWTDSWSENGTGILEGSRAIPDGVEAIRVVTPSIN